MRIKEKGGIHPDKYVDWFIPISNELYRVLKSTGTFILNIKENVVECVRSTYIMKLVLSMIDNNWLWTEEFIWYKKNSFPGKWPNRFRDSWEHLYQFNKNKKFNMYQEAVMIPTCESTKKRLESINNKNDIINFESNSNSKLKRNMFTCVNKDMVYPTNVIHCATTTNNKNHPASFPEYIPIFFIKLFTQQNDIVLDPFAGSGTTLKVANRLNRNSIGIEINEDYYKSIKDYFDLII
jgi:site-specific DNA-methyltransferase (adenine-specific)/site-specific DNA-methyltransferase (cytosine-N4-specific)